MTTTSKKWLSAKNKLPSFFMLPPAALAHPNMTKKKLQALGVIALFSNSAGEVTDNSPSEDKIAEILGWFTRGKPHRGTVSDQVAALVEDGWLTVIKRDGIDMVNHYQLHQVPLKITFTDRSTPEYLEKAEAKRRQVRKQYSLKHTFDAALESIPDPEEDVDFDALLDTPEVQRHLNNAFAEDNVDSVNLDSILAESDAASVEAVVAPAEIDKSYLFKGVSEIKIALRRIAERISPVAISNLELLATFAALSNDFPDLIVSYATVEEYLKRDIL